METADLHPPCQTYELVKISYVGRTQRITRIIKGDYEKCLKNKLQQERTAGVKTDFDIRPLK